MVVQLKLLKTPGLVAINQLGSSVQTFDQRGGTLGRSSSNSWVLPDPDRFLSSCHCEIVCDQGQFYLVDLSTNGTFINGSPEPLGKGMRAPISHGDTFEIGDYQFEVSLGSESADTTAESNPGPFESEAVTGTEAPEFANPFANEYSQDYFLNGSGGAFQDPLALLDGDKVDQISPALDSGPIPSDLHQDPFTYSSTVDHTPSLDESLNWPDSKQQNIIPDDWEDDLLSEPVSARTMIDALAREHRINKKDSLDPAPEMDEMAVRGRQEAAIVREDMRSGGSVHEAGHGNSQDQFIRAMGMDPDSLSPAQRKEINELGGRMLRELVEGMMQLLRSRSTIKNEFRMNVTTIEPFENNPFKFSVTVDDALENMFIKKSKAYKEPLDALHECFHELGEHQLAMIAGIREGFRKMMDRFDPNTLEKLFRRRGKYSPLPVLRHVRCWNNYNSYYARLNDNPDASFQSLFGSDFVQAYEDHLRQLSASRKKNKIKMELGL